LKTDPRSTGLDYSSSRPQQLRCSLGCETLCCVFGELRLQLSGSVREIWQQMFISFDSTLFGFTSTTDAECRAPCRVSRGLQRAAGSGQCPVTTR
jgi:hypothetical protein